MIHTYVPMVQQAVQYIGSSNCEISEKRGKTFKTMIWYYDYYQL